jgi:hypothetical protein
MVRFSSAASFGVGRGAGPPALVVSSKRLAKTLAECGSLSTA